MSKVPTAIRDGIRDRLWAKCDELGWMSLNDIERAQYYEQWTRDASIGGQLGHLMDPRAVRVYIKDTLVKPYVRTQLLLDEGEVWRLLDLTGADRPTHHYIKPHGRRLIDGRVLAWGRTREWKAVLMAVFERGHERPSFRPYGAVLLESGKTEAPRARALVSDAAQRLGIERVVWMDAH